MVVACITPMIPLPTKIRLYSTGPTNCRPSVTKPTRNARRMFLSDVKTICTGFEVFAKADENFDHVELELFRANTS
jgi:hypothetical protein